MKKANVLLFLWLIFSYVMAETVNSPKDLIKLCVHKLEFSKSLNKDFNAGMTEAKEALQKNIDSFIDDERIIPSEGYDFFLRCYETKKIMEKYGNQRNLSSYFRARVKSISDMILESCIKITTYSLAGIKHSDEEGFISVDAITKINEAYQFSPRKSNIRFLYETWKDSHKLLPGSENLFSTSIVTKKVGTKEQIHMELKWKSDVLPTNKTYDMENVVVIKTISGKTIRKVVHQEELKVPDEKNFVTKVISHWDGKDTSGNLIPEGEYTYVCYAVIKNQDTKEKYYSFPQIKQLFHIDPKTPDEKLYPVGFRFADSNKNNLMIPDDPDKELPIKVFVPNVDGKGIPNVKVFFDITKGTGSIGSLSTEKFTDRNGIATAIFRSIPNRDSKFFETTELRIAVDDNRVPPETAEIQKISTPKPGIEIFSGDGQTGIIGRTLEESLVVKVVDRNHENEAISGEEIDFYVAGSAVLTKDRKLSRFSNSEGLAGMGLIMGRSDQEENKITAYLGSEFVTFTAISEFPIFKVILGEKQIIPSVRRGNKIIVEGFIEGSGAQKGFGVQVTNTKGEAIEGTTVLFKQVGISKGILLPEYVITDASGKAITGLVMPEAGNYKVEALLLEFPEISGLEALQLQCHKLKEIAQNANSQSLVDILDSIRPQIPLIKTGNALIGANGKILPTPLTAVQRNRFGAQPKKISDIIDDVRQIIEEFFAGTDVEITGVEIRKQYNAIFNVVEGNAGLLKQPSSDVFTPPNIPGQQEIRIPIGKETTEPMVYVAYGKNPINPVKITVNFEGKVIVDISFVDYNPNGGSSINDLPNFNFNYQNHTSYFYLGSPYVEIVTKEDGKFVAAEYVHSWQNIKKDSLETINKYWIKAKMPLNEPEITKCGVESWDDFRKIAQNNEDIFGKIAVEDIPMKRVSNNNRYAEYLSEIPLVFVRPNQSFEGIDKFISDDYIYIQARSFCSPFAFSDDKEDGIHRHTPYLEIFGPGVYGENDKKWIRATLSNSKLKNMELPEIFTFTSISNEKAEIELFYKPYNESEVKLSIENFVIENQNQNQNRISKLTKRLEQIKNLINNMKKMGFSEERIDKKQSIRDELLREINELTKDKKIFYQILLENKIANAMIFFTDGINISPKLITPSIISDRPSLEISHVAQGGKLIARIILGGKMYEDTVTIVKAFTWNDYQRLKAKGKELRIHEKLSLIPKEFQENIINTIKFCLDPEGNKQQIHQVEQQIQENQKIYPFWNDKQHRKHIGNLLPNMPSAMSILPTFKKDEIGDTFHFHIFWHKKNILLRNICIEHINNCQNLYVKQVSPTATTLGQISVKKFRERIIKHYNTTMFTRENNNISNIEMFHKIIKEADRPRCEYHTYEWCTQQFNMYHKSPIRNIHTYLQNAKIQSSNNQEKIYLANKPELYLHIHAFKEMDMSTLHPASNYSSTGDFVFQIESTRKILDELNASKEPIFLREKFNVSEEAETKIKIIAEDGIWIYAISKHKFYYIISANDKLEIYNICPDYDKIQIDFFIDKEGRIVLAPFQYSYSDLSCFVLLIADALGEEVVIGDYR